MDNVEIIDLFTDKWIFLIKFLNSSEKSFPINLPLFKQIRRRVGKNKPNKKK